MSFMRIFKIFCGVIGIIFLIQIYLAYKSFRINETKVDDASALYKNKQLFGNHASGSKPSLHPSDVVNKSREFSHNKHGFEFSKDLEIDVPCDLTNQKDVISAVQRAKTNECKSKIVDVACKIKDGQFYPKSLPNTCPSGERQQHRYLGCYKDSHDDRLLSNYFVLLKTSNSPSKCINICLQSGFIFAGTQYSNECFCGNKSPPVDAKLIDTDCNMKCTGDTNATCGGYYSIAIYETGIENFVAQTAEVTTPAGARPVKIAFLLTFNGRAVRQVYRLIKALYSSEHFYFIHIDARERYLYRELLMLEKKFTNIRLSRERFSTIWGGASLLKMLLSSMKNLLEVDHDWDYVINLSESDFPVKTVERLVNFLTANVGRNFVKSHGRETQRFIKKQGLDKTFLECDLHMFRIGDRDLPNNVQIDGGSDWVGLTKEFVKYIIEEPNELVKGLLLVFEYTLLPAESFFHTVLRNSEFCNSYVDNNLHNTNWRRKLGCKCQYKHIVDWCGCSPNDFKLSDWDRLVDTNPKPIFFARKFEPSIDNGIINKVEQWISEPFPDTFVNVNSYWQNVFHHFDDTDDVNGLLSVSMCLIRKQSYKLNFIPGNILEITDFFESGHYAGFNILFEAFFNNRVVELEMLVKPNITGQISKTSQLSKRIQVLEVSSDFDQKEQVSRNFRKTLGPDSEPHLILKFAGNIDDTNFNFTILWYEPSGEVVEASEMYIEDASITSVNYYKPTLPQPLRSGVWLVKIFHVKTVIGMCRFLIVPKSFYLTKDFKQVIKDDSLNVLDDSIDAFYSIRHICVSAGNINNSSPIVHVPECSSTKWSSKAPDPKSDIKLIRSKN